MAKHLNKVIDIKNNTLAILHIEDMFVILQCVFHGIRLLRLRRIGCRETTNFFCPLINLDFRVLILALGLYRRLPKQEFLREAFV